ncbi:hypothetical protein K3495_g1462 [Podosphaera aphanis]|nr:hypothetical protein K3495_g1462 [Podosphaera aphanis]
MTCAYSIPQGEYFEWEDIITDDFAYAQQVPYLSDHQFAEKYASKFKGCDFEESSPLENHYFHWGEPQEPKQDKTIATTPEVLSPKATEKIEELSSSKNSICFPESNLTSDIFTRDDLEIFRQPSQNVDYLAFPWHKCEADLWASRKYLKISRKKKERDQLSERLENASWRALIMGRLQLDKVNPRSFNWSKDQDDTWLHGPFVSSSPVTAKKTSTIAQPIFRSKTKSSLTENTDEYPVKSILKYSSLSGIILRGSIVSLPIPRLRSKDTRTSSSRKQRKTLRFSSEVKQYLTLPVDSNNVTTSSLSRTKFHTPDVSFVLDQASSVTHPNEACNYELKPAHDTRSPSSARTPGIRKSSKRSISPSVCQVPSTRLRTEQAFSDVAALRCALRSVVGTHSSRMDKQRLPTEATDTSRRFGNDTMEFNVISLPVPPTNNFHSYAFAETDEMDWISGKEDQKPNVQPCVSGGLAAPKKVDGGFWRNFKGSSIAVDDSNNILSGLHSPPELTESRSDSVSEDEIDDEMEEYNLILG